MSERAILHSDLNCFFASVERVLNPEYEGKAIAVCGSIEDRHGIVLAKSELAKQAGVKTGMVIWQAKQLCPDLITVKPNYEYYSKFSSLVREIYYRFTDLVEPFGLDECWLDVTNSRIFGSPYEIAEKIRTTVKRELGLTVSIGVSYNKVFAKLGSDMKKPDAITEISRQNFRDKIWGLSVSNLLYVGRATTKRLNEHGIFTIGELALSPLSVIQKMLGVNGVQLWHYARGEDTSRVMHRDFVFPAKSLGHGITCNADLENEEEVWRVILQLSQDLGHRLRVHNLSASGVKLSVKSDDLKVRQYQAPLEIQTQSPFEIATAARRLFKSYEWDKKVRALSVTAIGLSSESKPFQIDLFADLERHDKQKSIDDAVYIIRNKFGDKAVRAASLLGNLKMPDNSERNSVLPGKMFE